MENRGVLVAAVTVRGWGHREGGSRYERSERTARQRGIFKQETPMTDFQSFRNAVLEDEDLQEQVISIVNTATSNGAGLGDGIATLAKTHGYTITSDEVYAHQDFLGQDGDLTDFELEMINGGGRSSSSC
jgi:hypothetical protein